MACKSRRLSSRRRVDGVQVAIVHCGAPSSVRVHVVPVDAHQHQHAFPNLADDLLVDGDARALDPLQHETHGGCVGCEEQWQQSCARQLELSVQEFVNCSDGVASTASGGAMLAVAPRLGHSKMALPAASRKDLIFQPKTTRRTPLRSLEHALEAW